MDEAPREVVQITADAGGGYLINVEVPAGSLAQLAKAYGEEADGEPTLQS
ncbi:MAG TPA: hypothetical protein VF064_02220 [Pyrinomonadaceae bacterium]